MGDLIADHRRAVIEVPHRLLDAALGGFRLAHEAHRLSDLRLCGHLERGCRRRSCEGLRGRQLVARIALDNAVRPFQRAVLAQVRHRRAPVVLDDAADEAEGVNIPVAQLDAVARVPHHLALLQHHVLTVAVRAEAVAGILRVAHPPASEGRAKELAPIQIVVRDAPRFALELRSPLGAALDRIVAVEVVLLRLLARHRDADQLPVIHEVVRDNEVAADDLQSVSGVGVVLGADDIAARRAPVAAADAQPVVNVIVLDDAAVASAPDLNPQRRAARAGDSVPADDEVRGAIVGEDAAAAGILDRAAKHLVPARAPGDANPGPPFRVHADVLNGAVGDHTVQHAVLARFGLAVEVDAVRAKGFRLDQIADRHVMDVEPLCVGRRDALIDIGATCPIQGEIADFDIFAIAEADYDARLVADEAHEGLTLPCAGELGVRLRCYRLSYLVGSCRQQDDVAVLRLVDGCRDGRGVEALDGNCRGRGE